MTTAAVLPAEEAERLAALRRYDILDTLPEQAYDDITFLAAKICDSPIALVSLVDEDRQWFKSKVGLDASETPRDLAFCAHAILDPGKLFMIEDATQDERFRSNPLVTDQPEIRFYAGAPLVTKEGLALGTICAIDRVPRALAEDQQEALRSLSRQVVAQLDLRRSVQELVHQKTKMMAYQEQLEIYQRGLEEKNAALSAESLADGLTKLGNRRAFERRLEEEVERAQRYGEPLSLMVLDVDHFKTYNDEFGHPAGDGVLREVARLLGESTRISDFVARHGGEEFAVVMPKTDAPGAYILAERCRKAVESAGWQQRPVTVSVGVATLEKSGSRPTTLLARADEALYEAKRGGRNRTAGAS